jgi:hypothetical protein
MSVQPSGSTLCAAATVFVVQDVLRSVEYYRDMLGFRTDYPYRMRDFNVNDLDGNDLCFGMESKTTPLR